MRHKTPSNMRSQLVEVELKSYAKINIKIKKNQNNIILYTKMQFFEQKNGFLMSP